MSHNIYMENGVFGKPTWHHEGWENPDKTPLTLEQVLERMTLGVGHVTKEPSYASATGEDPINSFCGVVWNGGYNNMITWPKTGKRDTVGRGIGDKYTIYQDMDVLQTIPRELLEKGEAAYESVFYTKNGSRFNCLLKLSDDVYNVNDGSTIETFLLISNTHDGSGKLTIKLVMTRVVCANTLLIALRESGEELKIPHTACIDARAEAATRVLGLAREQAEANVVLANRMVERELTIEEQRAFFKASMGINGTIEDAWDDPRGPKVLSTRSKNRLLEVNKSMRTEKLADSSSLWGFVNGVTNYVDFRTQPKIQKKHRADLTPELANAARTEHVFHGGGNSIKVKAWNAATKLVSV